MEKVDSLINTLAENIENEILSKRVCAHEIAEKTNALAELISARAMQITNSSIEVDNYPENE